MNTKFLHRNMTKFDTENLPACGSDLPSESPTTNKRKREPIVDVDAAKRLAEKF